MTHRLILASASPYRMELLGRLGIPFEALEHRCDERAPGVVGLEPDSLAARLSLAKAESLASLHPDAIVIGSDQVVDLDGEVLGKPHTAERAVAQLMALQGRSHRLVTGVALVAPGRRPASALDVHVMGMRAMSRGEVEVYVEREMPTDCAGSYKIEGLGISLFRSIAGADFTAIMGLPLITVSAMLRAVGLDALSA